MFSPSVSLSLLAFAVNSFQVEPLQSLPELVQKLYMRLAADTTGKSARAWNARGA